MSLEKENIHNKTKPNSPLKIFITGANGFIGSYITAKLLKCGYEIICAVRNVTATKLKFPSTKVVHFDFNDINLENLALELNDVDIVINVAGLFQSEGKNKINNVHVNGPKILYDTAVKAGVKRIIHISALGIDSENTTAYALSKKLAENYLKKIENIDWVILQPSVIYASGSYGGTSLFRTLATLPFFIPLVGDGSQQIQPIHIDDLTEIVTHCVKRDGIIKHVLKIVGPKVVTIKELLTNFRSWLGLKPAKLIKIPLIFIKLGAKIGDITGIGPLNSTLYKMMMQPNIADKQDLIDFTAITPRSFEQGLETEPLTIQSLWHARLFLLKPFLKLTLGLFWIFSGIFNNVIVAKADLHTLGEQSYSSILSTLILYFSSSINIIIGLLLLFSKKIVKICLVSIIAIAAYTLILTISKPVLLIDSLNILLQNILTISLTLVLMAIAKDKS